MIVNQQESIFNRAVRSMFASGYEPDRALSTTMSLPDAGRHFAMSQPQVLAAMRDAPTAEPECQAAAHDHGRVTVQTMIAAAMARKGGLRRVSAALASRAQARAKSVAKFMPKVRVAVDTLLKPLLANVRPMARDTLPRTFTSRPPTATCGK